MKTEKQVFIHLHIFLFLFVSIIKDSVHEKNPLGHQQGLVGLQPVQLRGKLK